MSPTSRSPAEGAAGCTARQSGQICQPEAPGLPVPAPSVLSSDPVNCSDFSPMPTRTRSVKNGRFREPFQEFADASGKKNGAQKRTRTSTPLRAPPPEDGASTNSAIWARSLPVIAAGRLGRRGPLARAGGMCQRKPRVFSARRLRSHSKALHSPLAPHRGSCPRRRIAAWRSADSRTASKST